MVSRTNIVAISWPGWSYDLSWENLRNVFTRVKILYIAALTQWIVLHFVFIKQQSASSVSSRLRQTHDWLKVYDQRRTWHLLADALGRDSSEELANWLALPDCSCNGKNLVFFNSRDTVNVSKIIMEENLLREKLEMYQFLERRGRALHIFFWLFD